MLKECIRHEHLAKIILHNEQFYDFFRYVEVSTFDIASDAFATFKVQKNFLLLLKYILKNELKSYPFMFIFLKIYKKPKVFYFALVPS